MKKYLQRLIIAAAALVPALLASGQSDGRLFPYPTPPEEIKNFYDRCDYMVSHFWDRCNFSTAFSSLDRLNTAFEDWASFMPHANADTVYASIGRVLERNKKSGPNTLKLAEIAERNLYTDSSDVFSEELFLPFARAAADHKKIKKDKRERFERYRRIIETSGLKARIPDDLKYVKPDGTTGSFGDVRAPFILLIINDQECTDCAITRVRLSADVFTRRLLENKQIGIVNLYAGNPSDEMWASEAASCPEGWVTGAMPDATDYFDLRFTKPSFYFLDRRHRVLGKQFGLENVLESFSVMYNKLEDARREAAAEPSDSTATK